MSKKRKNNKITIYVRNEHYGPSCYYRIIQYLRFSNNNLVRVNNSVSDKEYLKFYKKRNIFTKFFLYISIYFKRLFSLTRDLFSQPKIIIIQREIMPKFCGFLILALLRLCSFKSKIIWDFDDSILEGREISKLEFSMLEKLSRTIVVTHFQLSRIIHEPFYKKIVLLPTNDVFFMNCDCDEIQKNRIKLFESTINLIWVGTFSNIPFLNVFADSLDRAASIIEEKLNKKVVLRIVSNQPFLHNFKNISLLNIEWSRERAQELMLLSHIGLMPLIDSSYVQGKGGFKLIQYLSCGMPVIASNVGFNKEIVLNDYNGYLITNEKELIEPLVSITKDCDKWLEMSNNSFNLYKKKFAIEKNIDFWKGVLDE